MCPVFIAFYSFVNIILSSIISLNTFNRLIVKLLSLYKDMSNFHL